VRSYLKLKIIHYIYIVLFSPLKALYIEGRESPQPPMCSIHLDDATAAILYYVVEYPPHTSLLVEKIGAKSDKANQYMRMIRRP